MTRPVNRVPPNTFKDVLQGGMFLKKSFHSRNTQIVDIILKANIKLELPAHTACTEVSRVSRLFSRNLGSSRPEPRV